MRAGAIKAGFAASFIAVAAVSAGGCTIGNGSGTATGMLWILGCEDGPNRGTEASPSATSPPGRPRTV
jgi:hypothetical protein